MWPRRSKRDGDAEPDESGARFGGAGNTRDSDKLPRWELTASAISRATNRHVIHRQSKPVLAQSSRPISNRPIFRHSIFRALRPQSGPEHPIPLCPANRSFRGQPSISLPLSFTFVLQRGQLAPAQRVVHRGGRRLIDVVFTYVRKSMAACAGIHGARIAGYVKNRRSGSADVDSMENGGHSPHKYPPDPPPPLITPPIPRRKSRDHPRLR